MICCWHDAPNIAATRTPAKTRQFLPRVVFIHDPLLSIRPRGVTLETTKDGLPGQLGCPARNSPVDIVSLGSGHPRESRPTRPRTRLLCCNDSLTCKSRASCSTFDPCESTDVHSVTRCNAPTLAPTRTAILVFARGVPDSAWSIRPGMESCAESLS